ncbi:TIGR04219 family outer membrane beta-barrel protein [Psychrosphaera sp. B3R10]|uniref:TIGR04219 family outer membrane beta-barrel protein n=1 Tax=Psychrosphaera algicola TaxID=3023714 RepID=A0ABT5FB63_9GAMM|nr:MULTISPECIES: TIGR04219 family outer membrane beta-barrel protein [unclassified Psychrosphaera]MBU2881307.1 TIGR04219 family outer membrane beta-barrel protein [Psychrosphaera sp. I2R16]MBU2988406.1 TIGR04219 family outer membrane beta-barrel protein [Psychrosphaera sp. B3R10]MDC2888073.1 TIGR04219 family outer membrane beta-barrel protein [Psychrosphaera sp. G1-22]MDO6720094.1 TIGR04219 family outer membrane beta-barrel protein [Psychrosphaera sp. 1_MG-2023]
MKKTIATLGLVLASANVSALPLIDFWAGAYSWNTAYEGTISAGDYNIDLQDDLKLEDSNNNVIWAAFEHPIPLIPNLQVKQTQLETTGNGRSTQSFTYGGETYQGDVELDSVVDLTHTDITAYWGLPLPLVTINYGLNIRMFDGAIDINDGRATIDYPVPMLFARVGASLPFTGLEVMAEGNYIGIGETNHMDYQVVLRYTIPMIPVLDVNIEAGYRAFQLNIDPSDFDGDEDDLTADIDMSGVFLGVSFHL